MSKIKSTKVKKEATVEPNLKAKTAFEEYKRRMDENYEKEFAKKQQSPPSPSYLGFQPAYVFTHYEEPHFNTGKPPMNYENPSSQQREKNETSIIDSLSRLLDLSVKTINASLVGGTAIMNRFYGLGNADYSKEHDCDCEFCSQHYDPCCCRECHPGVYNC